jgi:hypothetical protein
MNEKIKELAEQAGLEMCGCGCNMPTRQSAKFAELIIKECIDNIETYPIGIVDSAKMEDVITHIVYALNAIRDEIKDNFGIKYER